MNSPNNQFPETRWFEMDDLKRRDVNQVVWVPLLTRGVLSKIGDYGHDGFLEEYAGAHAIMLHQGLKETALSLNWTDVVVNWDNSPAFENGTYKEAGGFKSYFSGDKGKYLVLIQRIESIDHPEWHLDQDLVLALKLHRENDSWLAPEEDFVEVARLTRNDSGSPQSLEIRAEHLKDYLNAQDCGLLVARYHRRIAITKEINNVPWNQRDVDDPSERYKWQGHVREIHDGGFPFGEKIAVFQTSRSDVHYEDDSPNYAVGPGDDPNMARWNVTQSGPKLFQVSGDLWKNDWVSPAAVSPRIRGDHEPSTIPFIIDIDGKTQSGDELGKRISWLFFRPSVVEHIRNRRGGHLNWYTGDTGSIGASRPDSIHFGTNALGFINVLAKDIVGLPEAHKKLWAAHNCSPEGGVSEELLKSQMETNPADTLPPETQLWENMMALQVAFAGKFSSPLFRSSAKFDNPKCHRFLAIGLDGLFLLSKEITRSTIEYLDSKVLKELTANERPELKPLKRLEKLITLNGANGYEIMGPLFAVYDLRQFDAHIPAEDISSELTTLGITLHSDNHIENGKILLDQISKTFAKIASEFER